MFAPTVFNFFRPGYVPSGKGLSDAGLVVPEMQLTHELSVAGYMNYIRAGPRSAARATSSRTTPPSSRSRPCPPISSTA